MRVVRILIGLIAATVGAGPQTAQIAEGKQKYDF
jgi:hypothetical protein